MPAARPGANLTGSVIKGFIGCSVRVQAEESDVRGERGTGGGGPGAARPACPAVQRRFPDNSYRPPLSPGLWLVYMLLGRTMGSGKQWNGTEWVPGSARMALFDRPKTAMQPW